MKVFISWSGEPSCDLAYILYDWLPKVIQKIEPYVSSKDIKKGEPWFQSISKGLDDASFGIICLTRKNITSPWLNFEAGALFQTVSSLQNKVCPLLLGITPEDLMASPLGQLQAAKCEKNGIKSLLETLNEEAGYPISSTTFPDVFETWWPKLDEKLKPLLKHIKPKIVWAFETSDAEGVVEDAIGEAENAGFPVDKKWFLDDPGASPPENCDLLVYVCRQSDKSEERLQEIVHFLSTLKKHTPWIIYAKNIHLGPEEMNIVPSHQPKRLRKIVQMPDRLVDKLVECSLILNETRISP